MGFIDLMVISTWCALMVWAFKPVVDWACAQSAAPKKQPRRRVVRPRPLVIVSIYD